MRRLSGHVLLHVALLAFFASALIISFVVTPDDLETGRVVLAPACTFHRLTGWQCPTCGLTRAFCALSHGQLETAWAYHRGALLVYVVFWLAAVSLGRSLLRLLAAASTANDLHDNGVVPSTSHANEPTNPVRRARELDPARVRR